MGDAAGAQRSAECERQQLWDAFSPDDAVHLAKGYSGLHVSGYNSRRLSTLMLFFSRTGTVFHHRVLWVEQLAILTLYALVAAAVWYTGCKHDAASAANLNSFADKMATLAAFLICFYTSLTVDRWWRIRTDGVGNMMSACSQLSLFVSQLATQDERVLSAIRRYARASLAIVFLKRRYGAENLVVRLEELVNESILTQDELDKLQGWKSNLSESIWTWHMEMVKQLYDRGLIKSEALLTFLLDKVNLGRSGAALIGGQLGTPIPLPYVHLLGCLVKLHNLILAIALGYLLGSDWEWQGTWFRIVTSGKMFFVPLLYNAILLINASLADPFDGHINDFPLTAYEQTMERDGESYVSAGDHLPAWIMDKTWRAA